MLARGLQKLADRLTRYAETMERSSATLSSSDKGDEEVAATPSPLSANSGPPSHWLELVRKRAPQLLQPVHFVAEKNSTVPETWPDHAEQEPAMPFLTTAPITGFGERPAPDILPPLPNPLPQGGEGTESYFQTSQEGERTEGCFQASQGDKEVERGFHSLNVQGDSHRLRLQPTAEPSSPLEQPKFPLTPLFQREESLSWTLSSQTRKKTDSMKDHPPIPLRGEGESTIESDAATGGRRRDPGSAVPAPATEIKQIPLQPTVPPAEPSDMPPSRSSGAQDVDYGNDFSTMTPLYPAPTTVKQADSESLFALSPMKPHYPPRTPIHAGGSGPKSSLQTMTISHPTTTTTEPDQPRPFASESPLPQATPGQWPRLLDESAADGGEFLSEDVMSWPSLPKSLWPDQENSSDSTEQELRTPDMAYARREQGGRLWNG